MTGVDGYKYAQWVITTGRSLRINPPPDQSVERISASWFVYWMIGFRPWLRTRYYQKSASAQGLVTFDNVQVAGKLVEMIGRDLMKIPIRNYMEESAVYNFIGDTLWRKYGVGGGGISPGVND